MRYRRVGFQGVGRMRRLLGIAVSGVSGGVLAIAAVAAEPVAELRQAAAAYVEAFNKGDAAAIADQWTERASLVEGDQRLEGRAAIAASLEAWRKRHPEATLAIEVVDVDLLAEPLARVAGVMRYTPRPGEKSVSSRFTSLRVREGAVWRIAESIVVPEHAAALAQLDSLIGTWTAVGGDAAAGTKTEIETVYEKPLGSYCIVGRTRIKRAGTATVEALEVIHADRASGLVRCWIFDSSGACGEGVIESDGTTLDAVMIGTPSASVAGRVARWVRVIAPTGADRCTVHAVERSIDGLPVADSEPLHFRRVP